MAKQYKVTVEATLAALSLAQLKLRDAARVFERSAEDNKTRREKYDVAKAEGMVTIGLSEIPSPEYTENAWLENAKLLRNIAVQLNVR